MCYYGSINKTKNKKGKEEHDSFILSYKEMKKFNKILSGLLASLMLITSVPVNAVAPIINTENTSMTSELTETEVETSDIVDSQETSEETSNEVSINDMSEDTNGETGTSSETSEETTSETTENTSTETSENTSDTSTSETTESSETSTEVSESSEETTSETETQSSETEQPSINDIDSLDDTEDDEEIVYGPLDGWELSLKLYDKDVNNGRNPVDTIDWDATQELSGTPERNHGNNATKAINMQINYHNEIAPVDYEPGALTFIVPNIAYNMKNSTGTTYDQIYSTIIVGANDSTHAGYDWDFVGYDNDMSQTYTSPSTSVAFFKFTNANKIEAGTNFEGSIQIAYSFTSYGESAEVFIDECFHSFEKSFNSHMMLTETFDSLVSGFRTKYNEILDEETNKVKESIDYDTIVSNYNNEISALEDEIDALFDQLALIDDVDILESPNWPNAYPNNMTESKYYYNYYFENANQIILRFDNNSIAESGYDYIYVYDMNTGEKIDTLNGTLSDITKVYDTNNIKITLKSDGSVQKKFKAFIYTDSDISYEGKEILNTIFQKQDEVTQKEQELSDFKTDYDNKVSEATSADKISILTYNEYFVDEENILNTNAINFNYERTYTHPWVKEDYSLTESAYTITNADVLPSNWEDYTWVRYYYYAPLSRSSYSYPYLYVYYSYASIMENFGSDVIVIGPRGDQIHGDDEGNYVLTWDQTHVNSYTSSTQRNYREVYVGYPKSIYNEENNNLQIENKAELWGPYGSSDREDEYLAEDSVTLNLADFSFEYPIGDIAAVGKYYNTKNYAYYQNITRDLPNKATYSWELFPTFNYHGTPTTIKLGDDLLYSTDNDGNITRVSDDDYYYTSIHFPYLYNTNYKNIDEKYDCELWIRHAGDSEYELEEEFKNTNRTWSFSESDSVVAYYFIIKDIEEGLKLYSSSNSYYFTNTLVFKRQDIPQSGNIYNFDYLQLYTRDSNGDLVWINEWSEDNYSTTMTQLQIGEYDKETYGGYLQRAVANSSWSFYVVSKPKNYSYPSITDISSSQITQDEEKEEFRGEFTTKTYLYGQYQYEDIYFEDYDKNYMIDGISTYFVLPQGMKLESTRTEILNSIASATSSSYRTRLVDNEGNAYYLKDIFKLIDYDDISINIIENWKGSGKTKIDIHIPFPEKYFVFYYSGYNTEYFNTTFKFSVSYDAYSEYGSSWRWYAYSHITSDTYAQTAGNKDSEDVNGNGSTNDYIYSDNSSYSIISVISSHQDVLTQVSSTLSNFASGVISAEYDKTYTYKLRVRTGQNDVTNLVVYDNLESWSRNKDGEYKFLPGKRNYWQGSLESIDTSYAENKGFNVKIWYSENEKAGTLAEDSSWKEYSDSVDKTKVKSLAFQYLDSEGKPIVVPGNTLTYILINMKAPSGDPKIRTLAYNACWTQWNAIDVMGEMVDEITGIKSNTVKVALPDTVAAETIPSIKLIVKKDIVGEEEAFENMGLDPNGTYNFQITLVRNNEDGSQSEVTGVVTNKTNLVISSLEEGTWLIKESDDPYFDFVSMVEDNDSEFTTPGVTFEETDEGYVLVVDEDVDADAMFTIKVTNEIEPDRHYEDKEDKTNLFSTQEEETTPEPTSLLDKLIDLFE